MLRPDPFFLGNELILIILFLRKVVQLELNPSLEPGILHFYFNEIRK